MALLGPPALRHVLFAACQAGHSPSQKALRGRLLAQCSQGPPPHTLHGTPRAQPLPSRPETHEPLFAFLSSTFLSRLSPARTLYPARPLRAPSPFSSAISSPGASPGPARQRPGWGARVGRLPPPAQAALCRDAVCLRAAGTSAGCGRHSLRLMDTHRPAFLKDMSGGEGTGRRPGVGPGAKGSSDVYGRPGPRRRHPGGVPQPQGRVWRLHRALAFPLTAETEGAHQAHRGTSPVRCHTPLCSAQGGGARRGLAAWWRPSARSAQVLIMGCGVAMVLGRAPPCPGPA